ncbi:MAG: tRNA pseudouridine(38-40) synthase TruA, partial [Candidatus Omnitrophica bacterium]|nr:tRNA pseudouridine(38-40) synthase TruA [Candidatus Omnitrophota bacterium]
MRNIKLIIEYKGTGYNGWQRQKNTNRTIQGIIENTLKRILKERVALVSSGRTDAGVHALGQVANFKTNSKLAAENIRRALNALLPSDIIIKRAEEARPSFHARFDAKSKLYRYIILNREYPSALWRNFSCFYHYPLEIKLMRRAARYLLGRHDFRCFQAAEKKPRDSIRTITKLRILKLNSFIPALRVIPKSMPIDKGPGFIYIDIQADGFLYKMVRNIAGALIETGIKKQPPENIKKLLALKNRKFSAPTAPASGLYLF